MTRQAHGMKLQDRNKPVNNYRKQVYKKPDSKTTYSYSRAMVTFKSFMVRPLGNIRNLTWQISHSISC